MGEKKKNADRFAQSSRSRGTNDNNNKQWCAENNELLMMMTAVAITTTILSIITTDAVDTAASDHRLRFYAIRETAVSVCLLRTASGRLAATVWPGPLRIRRPTRIG